jgi:hypothetical protein
MEEYDVVCHLLLTLPPEYEMIVTALETLSCEKLRLPFGLLQSTAVFRAQTGGGGGRNQRRNSRNAVNTGRNNPQFQFTCYNCGVPGHKRYDCPKPQQPWRPLNQQPQARLTESETDQEMENVEVEFSFLSSMKENKRGKGKKWFLDSEHLSICVQMNQKWNTLNH